MKNNLPSFYLKGYWNKIMNFMNVSKRSFAYRYVLLPFFTLIMLVSFFLPNVTLAANTNFSIAPINPDTNQPQSSYYDLKLLPGEQKDIQVQVYNNGNSDITINVTAKEAGTNDYGVISYAGDIKKDPSLKIPFSKIAKLEHSKVTIPAKGSTFVTVHIKMPKKKLNGEILGGIRVTSNDDSEPKDKAKNSSVRAKIAYSVAVLIKGNGKTFSPKIKLLSVQPESRDNRDFVSATLKNYKAVTIKKMTVTEEVYKKGSDKPMYKLAKDDLQMAPNTKFNLGVDLGQHLIKPGNYTMKINGKADGKKFHFNKDFTITSKQAKDINENSVYNVDDSNNSLIWVYVSVGVLLLVAAIASVYFYMKNKKRKKKQSKKKSKSTKRKGKK